MLCLLACFPMQLPFVDTITKHNCLLMCSLKRGITISGFHKYPGYDLLLFMFVCIRAYRYVHRHFTNKLK